MFDTDSFSAPSHYRATGPGTIAPRQVSVIDPLGLMDGHKGGHRTFAVSEPIAKNVLDLIVYWDKPLGALTHVLQGISDWSPFELISAAPLSREKGAAPKIHCRFYFHAGDDSRAHYERNLKDLLKTHAVWEDAQPPDRVA